jgi:Tfp pilus assembly protein PilW
MNAQRGMSLVSLMVGLVVSLVATVGLLSVYHNSLVVTTSAIKSSTNDSQLASLLLRTGASIEDAGYGIASASFGTQMVTLSGAVLTGTTLTGTVAAAGATANAIVWATHSGATTQCAGFVAPPMPTGGLVYLQPTTCANAAAWSALAWPSTTVAGQSTAPIYFTVTQQTCEPYGITATTAKYLVTISSSDSIGASVSSQQCLMNFQ